MTFSNLPEKDITITVAIFPSENITNYGKVIGQKRVYCENNKFISNKDVEPFFNGNVSRTSPTIKKSFRDINITSIYNVIIAFCDFDDQLIIENGTISFLNAYGYLPASRYHLLTVCYNSILLI